MPTVAAPFVEVVLAWTRELSGTTAVLKREPGGGWDELACVEGSEYRAAGLDPRRTHVFAAAPVLPDGGLAPEKDWETLRIVPLESVPLPGVPTAFSVVQEGATLHAVWQAPTAGPQELTYEIREGATWEDGRRVANAVTGTAHSLPWWASGARTMWIRAVDRFGRDGPPASASLTIEPLGDHLEDGVLDQSGGGFAGTKEHVDVDGGDLRLLLMPARIGGATEPFGSYRVPVLARFHTEGTYETAPFDAGQQERQRLEVDLVGERAVAPLPLGRMRIGIGRRRRPDGARVPLGARNFANSHRFDLRPTTPLPVDVELDTSPTAAGAWEGWRPYTPGTYAFRRVRFRVRVRGDGLRTLRISTLVIRRWLFNRKAEGVVALTAGDTAVSFPVPFQRAPTLTFAAVGFVGAFEIVAVSTTGFSLRAYELANPSGTYDPGLYAPPDHEDANTAGVPDTYSHPPYTPATLDKSFAAYAQRTTGQVHWQALGP